ncbi:MAG: DegV family protein [Coriobacteriia bacterium]|nr:DegV family protein [Coriobacteriia bacterium]
MAVKIVTDSTASLTTEEITDNNIKVVTLFLVSDGAATPEIEIDTDAYYLTLNDLDALPTSAQPTPASFLDAFNEVLNAGDDVLAIFTASGLSGTYEGARMMARQIKADRPDVAGRISIVDSTSNGRALAYPVLAAAKAAAAGANLETCTELAKYTSSCTRFVFAPQSLEHLRRGGRIGRASALLGTALKLVPVLGPDKKDGTVHTYAKVRTLPRAMDSIKNIMMNDSEKFGGLKSACVHNIADVVRAEEWTETTIRPLLDGLLSDPEIPVMPVPPVIGTHVGPAIGIAWVTNKPLPQLN